MREKRYPQSTRHIPPTVISSPVFPTSLPLLLFPISMYVQPLDEKDFAATSSLLKNGRAGGFSEMARLGIPRL